MPLHKFFVFQGTRVAYAPVAGPREPLIQQLPGILVIQIRNCDQNKAADNANKAG